MATAPSVSYSMTIRLEVPASGTAVSQLTTAVESSGGSVTGLDVTASGHEKLRIDVTIAASSTAHADQIVQQLRGIEGVTLGKVSDRTFLMHLGGKIEMASKHPIRNRDDLSMVYTPGVARVCMAIAENPEDARRLTIKRNSVAVVTDGSAVLGLGNIGPKAALPVMEGKAALFKRFAGIDAWPICLDTQDTDAIVEIVKAIAPGFAGINLEDISAPRCFEIEARLREALDIPVFHDDQHGTAIVVLAALTNALRVADKAIGDIRVVMSGAGAAGTAILKLLIAAGVKHAVVADIHGVVHADREDLVDAAPGSALRWIADNTNPEGVTGTLKEAVRGADVFIGVSAPQRPRRRRRGGHGRRRDRVRAREPRPRGRPGNRPPDRGSCGHRPLRLPQPDQQRAGLPGRLPRSAGRAVPHGQHGDDAGGREGAGGRRHRGRTQPELHRPERVQRQGRGRGRGRGAGGREGGRCGPGHLVRPLIRWPCCEDHHGRAGHRRVVEPRTLGRPPRVGGRSVALFV
ncbi:hypothetical protein GCM10020295_51280 [Streptomyces cinereospinus]